MDVWPRFFDVNLANLLGNPSFFRQLRTLLEGYTRVPTSTERDPLPNSFSSVTTFESLAKNKIPDLLVVHFGGGVPDFPNQIFLFWITLFGMSFINAFKKSINFKRTESCR